MAPARLLVVVGMRREASVARGRRPRRRPETLVGTDELETVLTRRPACVLSFGLCGALDPTLSVGDLVLGSGAVSPHGSSDADRLWLERLREIFPQARVGAIPATADIIENAAAKAELHAASGAIAVDIESGRVAAEADRAGVPFAILRCVSDAADRTLPRSAIAGFEANGRVAPGRVLASLLRRPWELPELFRTALDAGRALRRLRDARDLLGPGLGCPYLG